jgi:hypothetical protein
MTFSETVCVPAAAGSRIKNPQRGGVPNGGFIVALLANTVTGDAARRKRVAFHAAVCDAIGPASPCFPAVARRHGLMGRWGTPALSLGQAAKACGRSKSALSRDIKAGKFSTSRNPDRPRRTV